MSPVHPWSRSLRALPVVVGLIVVAVAVGNLLNIVWPGMADHLEVLSHLMPETAAPWAHALAAPVAILMLVLGRLLIHRRRAAWAIAVALLGVMAVMRVGAGDIPEAVACAGLAVVLACTRNAFVVMPPPDAVRQSLRRLPIAAGSAFIAGLLSILIARGDAVPEMGGLDVLRETAALITWRSGPADFPGAFSWLPEGLLLVGIAALVVVLAPLTRRPPAPRPAQTPSARRRVEDLVARHDSGSLATFLLRPDHHWLFSDDRDAVLSYRVEAGVLLVAGDPVGHPDALPGLARKAADLAVQHDLTLGVMATSEPMRDIWTCAHLRALYIGDEAMVVTEGFSLEGRPIRKVRQSVTRLEREGYAARLVRVRDLSRMDLRALEAFRAECRAGEDERGFSMTLGCIEDPGGMPSWLVLVDGSDGVLTGLMHFVPGDHGRTQSLCMQLRNPSTPNGLMELMVVTAVLGLREHGVQQVSLNFVTGGRYLRAHDTLAQRAASRSLRVADRWFQVKSLEKFTEKFFPRWDPRYLMYPGIASLLRVGLAAMWAEGQIPRPTDLIRRAVATAGPDVGAEQTRAAITRVSAGP